MRDVIKAKGVLTGEVWTLREGQTEAELLAEIDAGKTPDVRWKSKNIWLTTGKNELLKLISGASTSHFNSTNTQIGVSTDSTAAAASQTGLIGSSTKYKTVDSGYPTTPSAGSTTYRATFLTNEANFDNKEWVLYNSSSGLAWNRIADAGGTTKTSSQIRRYTITVTM